MNKPVSLFDAIRVTGWVPIKIDRPGSHPDRIGKQQAHSRAAVLSKGRIAVRGNSWEYCYAVAHEICESQCGFKHSEQLFINQSNLLAMWHTFRSTRTKPTFITMFYPGNDQLDRPKRKRKVK